MFSPSFIILLAVAISTIITLIILLLYNISVQNKSNDSVNNINEALVNLLNTSIGGDKFNPIWL